MDTTISTERLPGGRGWTATGRPVPSDDVRSFACGEVRSWTAGEFLQAPGGPAPEPWVMLNGWAGWVRMLPDGRRQILRLLLPGDVGPSARGVTPDCAVVALTRSRTAVIGLADAPDLPRRQRIAEALRRLAQEEEADLFGQLVRLGRLSAYERTAHLMLSLFMRLQRAGEASGDTMDMPLTQEVLGDVLGLSVVHVNRTLKQLREEGLIVCRGGKTRVPAPEALAAACGSEVGLGSPLASARRYAAARPVESGSWHGAAQPS